MIILGQGRALTLIRATHLAAKRPYCIVLVSAMAACAAGCAPANAPTLRAGTAPIETGAIVYAPSGQALVDTAISVQGTPTEVYSLIARGALGCWFAANGPL